MKFFDGIDFDESLGETVVTEEPAVVQEYFVVNIKESFVMTVVIKESVVRRSVKTTKQMRTFSSTRLHSDMNQKKT